MEIRETVQRNVARYIKGSDYTQAEIARMLRVSKPTVTNWIKGVNTPNIELLNQLCRILNISFSEMFEESPNAYTQAPPDEQQLVTDYRSFNDEGKEKVREYVADLKGNPRYKKRDEPAVDQQA